MKKITAKVITVSSQLLVVGLFILLLFSTTKGNDKTLIVSNDNFGKMADMTHNLFKKEELMIASIDDEVLVELDKEEVVPEEEPEEEVPVEVPSFEVKEENPEEGVRVPLDDPVLETHVGNLTGYGADCPGCSGRTSSGFDLTKSIYYEDEEYGSIRILAADPMFPFYSIFRVNIPNGESFIAIVLDRGSNVGYGRGTLFDLAYFTEDDPDLIGLTRNVTFELLRRGK